jgi:hypothetical protein
VHVLFVHSLAFSCSPFQSSNICLGLRRAMMRLAYFKD